MQLLYLRSTAIADDNRAARDITCQVTPHFGNSDQVLFLLGLVREALRNYISLKEYGCAWYLLRIDAASVIP